jgi:hypothetical protein
LAKSCTGVPLIVTLPLLSIAVLMWKPTRCPATLVA